MGTLYSIDWHKARTWKRICLRFEPSVTRVIDSNPRCFVYKQTMHLPPSSVDAPTIFVMVNLEAWPINGLAYGGKM